MEAPTGGGGRSGPRGVGPKFTHIHCSSRYDRSAESLENDLDDWMDQSSIITVTEVTNNRRASRLREKGWNYYNSKGSADKDNCAIAWRTDDWQRRAGVLRRLSDKTYARLNGRAGLYLYSATVVLHRRDTGHSLMVSVTHFPAHVEGTYGFRTDLEQWAGRKQAYLSALDNWSTHVHDLERKYKTDGTLIIADWNLNLKDKWVLDLLDAHWGPNYHLAWQNFPTTGGGLSGGPTAPDSSPGKGTSDRIIDGTIYKDLKVTDAPDLMARVRSTDHRPYKESFGFLSEGEKPSEPDKPHGDVKKGHEWWGFGDYMDDEIYELDRVTEASI